MRDASDKIEPAREPFAQQSSYTDTSQWEHQQYSERISDKSRRQHHQAADKHKKTVDEFVARIDIPSTRAYVTSVLERYRKLKNTKQSSPGSNLQNGHIDSELTLFHKCRTSVPSSYRLLSERGC